MKWLLVVVCVAACLAGAARGAAVGDVRVLVIRATWGPTPDNVSILEQAAPFYSQASFGQLRLHVDITPWLHAYDEATCPSDGEAAKAAARAAGYDVDSYASVAYVIPEEVCDFQGVARGNEILLADPSSFVHELGHTFGLEHATSYICGHGGCKHIDEYGDPLSPMGHGAVDFIAYEKLKLGWISAVQRVDRSRAYAVGDIDLPSGSPQALVVPANAGEYWIEHRSSDTRRLIVRLVPPKGSRTIFIGAPHDRFAVAKIFSVTRDFRFTWLDRKRPSQPHVHALDWTVAWWTRSIDRGSGVATYRVMLDGRVLATTAQTRVTLPELSGTHRLAVRAIDRAGNQSPPGILLLHIS